MHIAQHPLLHQVLLAPMAGLSDAPFRQLCRSFGADYCVAEMASARADLRHRTQSLRRSCVRSEKALTAVQLLGVDAADMGRAARAHIEDGARVIDINMGCPARKVCRAWAGSALMRNEPLAARIVQAVVAACAPQRVSVTLKMRTGWSHNERNAVALARMAQDEGVAMLVVHGRTREQGYGGCAEYDTIAAVKAAVRIPVVANGDIHSPEKAAQVLRYTRADGVMVGRAALGQPWLLGQVAHYLQTATHLPAPTLAQLQAGLRVYLNAHMALYGEAAGVRSARRGLNALLRRMGASAQQRQALNAAGDAQQQWQALEDALQSCYLPCINNGACVGTNTLRSA